MMMLQLLQQLLSLPTKVECSLVFLSSRAPKRHKNHRYVKFAAQYEESDATSILPHCIAVNGACLMCVVIVRVLMDDRRVVLSDCYSSNTVVSSSSVSISVSCMSFPRSCPSKCCQNCLVRDFIRTRQYSVVTLSTKISFFTLIIVLSRIRTCTVASIVFATMSRIALSFGRMFHEYYACFKDTGKIYDK